MSLEAGVRPGFILSASENSQRSRRLAEWIQVEEIPHLLETLNAWIQAAVQGDRDARHVLSPGIMIPLLRQHLPRLRQDEMRQFATDAGHWMLTALFSDPLPIAEEPPLYSFTIPDLRAFRRGESITLGERRSLARSNNRKILERMVLDPDPIVLGHVLNNPRTRELDVVKAASRRPNRPVLLEAMANHGRWGVLPRIGTAIAFHPNSPPQLAMAILLTLETTVTREAAGDENLHPMVRDFAAALQRLRHIRVVD